MNVKTSFPKNLLKINKYKLVKIMGLFFYFLNLFTLK